MDGRAENRRNTYSGLVLKIIGKATPNVPPIQKC